MNPELIRLLIPVLIESIHLIRELNTEEIENMTLSEIRELLIQSETKWPELDFGE